MGRPHGTLSIAFCYKGKSCVRSIKIRNNKKCPDLRGIFVNLFFLRPASGWCLMWLHVAAPAV